MKAFFSLVCVLFFTSIFAQNTQLFEHTWYLHKIVVNSGEIFPPQVNDVASNSHNFEEQDNEVFKFATGFCDFIQEQIWFEGENQFTLSDDPAVLLGACGFQESLEFNNDYFGIYYNSQIALNPFTYTITNGTGDDKLLVITNPDGNSAHYGNFMLSNSVFKDAAFHIYPNPVVDELNIETDVTVIVLKIYTADGRDVMTESLQPEQTRVNVEGLSKGIYMLQLTDEQDRVHTSKFIKM